MLKRSGLRWKAYLNILLAFLLALPVSATQPPAQPKGLTVSQAVEILHDYDQMKLTMLLGPANSALTAEKLHRLDVVWVKLAHASQTLGLLPNVNGYLGWWAQNKMSMLANRQKAGDVSAQNFFHQTLQIFMAEKLGGPNPYATMKWYQKVLSNPYLKTATTVTVVGSVAVLSYMLGIVKGALVAGPAASMVSAFVEPYVRRPRDQVRLAGERFKQFTDRTLVRPVSRIFGKGREAIVGKPEAPIVDEADLEKNDRNISNSRRAMIDARRQISGLGYNLPPGEYNRFIENVVTNWRDAHGAWLQTIPEIDRAARSTFSDATRFRPQHFSSLVTQNVQAAEQFLQGAENVRRDIIIENPDNRVGIKEVANVLQTLNEEAIRVETYEPEKLPTVETHIEEASQKLQSFGADAQQIQRLNKSYRFAAKMQMAAAYNLAVHIQHEIEYEEFNRSLPQELAKQVASVRESLGLDFFHREFRSQVVAQLDLLGLKVSAHEEGAATLRKAMVEERIRKSDQQRRFERVVGDKGAASTGTTPAERARADKAAGTERNLIRDAVRAVRRK